MTCPGLLTRRRASESLPTPINVFVEVSDVGAPRTCAAAVFDVDQPPPHQISELPRADCQIRGSLLNFHRRGATESVVREDGGTRKLMKVAVADCEKITDPKVAESYRHIYFRVLNPCRAQVSVGVVGSPANATLVLVNAAFVPAELQQDFGVSSG
jgi:hypothetical protein